MPLYNYVVLVALAIWKTVVMTIGMVCAIASNFWLTSCPGDAIFRGAFLPFQLLWTGISPVYNALYNTLLRPIGMVLGIEGRSGT